VLAQMRQNLYLSSKKGTPFMAIGATTVTCAQREQLVDQFQQSLERYHQALTANLDRATLDNVVEATKDLYEICVKARIALQAHEHEHECLPTNGFHSGPQK
jgi:hypothetical protein